MLGGFCVARKGQRSGVFDLEYSPPIKLVKESQEYTESLGQAKPRIMIDVNATNQTNNRISARTAFLIVKEQMRLANIRQQTIKEYEYVYNRLLKTMQINYLDELTLESLYGFLDALGDVKDITKQSKLRVLKAVLNRFYDNGWLNRNFWREVKIKVDNKIKPPANENNLAILLSLLDMSNFIHFRDAVAVLTIYKCGLRMSTLVQLEEKHIDFNNRILVIQGDIMKGREAVKLPFDDELDTFFKRLIKQNDIIRKHYRKQNEYLFVSKFGDRIFSDNTPNAITKRLSYYAKRFGLEQINPHAIRRLYAVNLLKKGANVALISKALSHKSLATTTVYLGLTTDEVANNLRDYL